MRKRMFVLLLFLLFYIPSYAPNKEVEIQITYTYEYQFTPSNKKEEMVWALYHYREVYLNHKIFPEVGITQAIVEQGWDMERHKKNKWRIYNLTPVKGQKYATVFDNYTKRWRNHCTYHSLDNAIKHYGIFVNRYPKYYSEVIDSDVITEQLFRMGVSGYAEASNYLEVLFKIYFDDVAPIMEKIKGSYVKVPNLRIKVK